MYCNKCHCGHETWKPPVKCLICGSADFVNKNPFPTKPFSMRAMWKRKDYKGGAKAEAASAAKAASDAVTADIKDIVDNTKSTTII